MTANEPATRSRRESGAASVVSRYPRSSATEISRLIERTAKNAIASGTIRLNISASRYASTVSRLLDTEGLLQALGVVLRQPLSESWIDG